MRKGRIVKTFFGGVFIEREKLEVEGIKYPIKLEYYKTEKEEENVKSRYGIEVVKREYLEDNIKVETKEIKNVTNNVQEIDEILGLLKNNEVTPVGLEDVMQDLIKN